MSKPIRIYDKDVAQINEIVGDKDNEMSWPAKITLVVDKASEWEERGSDVL